MMQVQRVPERRVAMLPVRRRDVQGFAAVQLHPGRHEVQFYPPALGVLMAHPRDVVLLRVHPRKGQTLEDVHGLALLILGRCIFGCKGQNAVRVAPFAVDAVDQVAGPVHVAPHHLGRCMAAPFLARQVFRNLTPAAAAPAGELNQHRRAAHALPGSPLARGRSRSGGSEGLSFQGTAAVRGARQLVEVVPHPRQFPQQIGIDPWRLPPLPQAQTSRDERTSSKA